MSHPFLFLNHGPLDLDSIDKCSGAYLGFAQVVPDEARKAIRDGCPAPIRGTASFRGALLSIETPGDVFPQMIAESYGTEAEKQSARLENYPELSEATVDAFSADVTRWVQSVHELHALVFALGPGNPRGSDPWHEWSRAHFTETVVPFLERLVAETPALETDEPRTEPFDAEFATLRQGHIACLLQEFDPYHEIPIPEAFEERTESLIERFPL